MLPLALAQFLASYDTSSMSVAISNVAHDLDTTVTGVQTAISLFTLTMAALMVTGSKLTDIWGRRRCFLLGISVYALGASITALSPTIGVFMIGISLLEGVGSALMIPPIYILMTVSFEGTRDRARVFGVISAMAGIGAAAGPLIGGALTSWISWRASFAAEVAAMVLIWFLARRRVHERAPAGPRPSLDLLGAVLSAAGLAFIVLGILQANAYGWITARKDFAIAGNVILSQGSMSPVWLFVAAGLLCIALFALHIRRRERRGRAPLIAPRLFANRTSNLGLATQMAQWFMIVGGGFVVSVFLQVARGYSAIETGILITPTTAGILLASVAAPHLAHHFAQRTLIRGGFAIALAGLALLFLMVSATSPIWSLTPGLLCFGTGIGIMLTASVNVVQSSVPHDDQGEISGVSRSASNLGSSMGVAIAGVVLVSGIIAGVSARTNSSSVLSPDEKQQISVALGREATALSDAQLRVALQGQPQAVVDEVARINNEARNEALGYALFTLGAAGLLGLAAAMFLPNPHRFSQNRRRKRSRS